MKKIIPLLLVAVLLLSGCSSKVPESAVPFSVSINEFETTIPVGATEALTYEMSEVEYEDYTIDEVWYSDDESVATVEDGILVAISPGYADINLDVSVIVDGQIKNSSYDYVSIYVEEPYSDTTTGTENSGATGSQTTQSTYSQVFEDSNGYKIEVTVNMGQWIKGSDASLLESEWASVGGKGSMPLTAGSYTPKYDGPKKFTGTQAAYIFGNVSIRNATPEFPADNFGGGHCLLYMSSSFSTYERKVIHSTQYSNETRTYFLGEMDGRLISADLKSNSWGPVPFVLAVDDTFTPNTPDGNPELDNINLRLNCASSSSNNSIHFETTKSW